MFRRVVAALVIVAALIGSQVIANPAHASLSQCQAGQFCTWKGYTYSGAMYYYTYSPTCYEIGPDWDNKIVSVYNNSGAHGVYLYNSHGCNPSGGIRYIPPGVAYADLCKLDWACLWASSLRFT